MEKIKTLCANHKIRKIIFFLGAILISGLIAIGNRQNNYYEWNFQDTAISNEDNQGGAKFAIDRGNYQIKVMYNTTSDTAACDVYNNFAVDSQNVKGIVLAKQELPKGQNEITFPLYVKELNAQVMLRPLCEEGDLTLQNILVKSVEPYYTDSIFLFFFFWSVFLVFFYYCKKRGKSNAVVVTTILLVTVITTLPFCTDFMIWGDDLAFHMARTEGIYRALQAGQFPVRLNMVQANGYGFASPIMYPELFLYIPAILRFTGISLMLAFKVFIALINFATAAVSYKCFTAIVKSKYTGLAGSVIYTLCSYRLIDLYIREATGEVLAMVFLPVILYGMYEIFIGDYKKWIWAAIGYTCVLQSHILSLFMTIIFSILFAAVFTYRIVRDKNRLLALAKAAITTVLLNLWFLIPFLSYSKLDFPALNGGVLYNLHEQSIYLPQMITMFLKPYELSGNFELGKIQGEMPLSMGMILAVGVGIFLVSSISLRGAERNSEVEREMKIGWVALIFGGLALFMTSWLFPWDAIQKWELIYQLFSKMQFPWRLLMIVSLTFSIVSMIGVHLLFLRKWEDKRAYTVKEQVLFSILVMSILSSLYLIEGTSQMESSSNKAEFTGINYTDGMYYFANTDDNQWAERGNLITASPDAEIHIRNYTKKGNNLAAEVRADEWTESSYLELPLAYYPGYIAIINDQTVPVSKGDNNVARIPIIADEASIQIQFKEEKSWIVGNFISILTVIGLLLMKKNNMRNQGKKVLVTGHSGFKRTCRK